MRTILYSSPNDLQPYVEAYKKRMRMIDNQMWQMGIYVQRAVGVAVAACLAGKKSKAKYFDEPLTVIAEREAERDEYYRKIGTTKEIENFKRYVEIFNAQRDLKDKGGG